MTPAMTADATVDLLLSLIREHRPPMPRHGIARGGGYDSARGRVEALYGDTYAATNIDGEIPTHYPNVVYTNAYLDQYAAFGEERMVLTPTRGGIVGSFLHDDDDWQSPKPGERFIMHRKSTDDPTKELTIDAFIKFLNDGANAGDALGAIDVDGASLFHLVVGGHTIVVDKTNDVITITHRSGTESVAIQNGVIQINAATQVVITCPDVELGGTGGASLAYKSEVEALTQIFNEHQHIDPAGGTVSPPTTQSADPVGTVNTKAI